MVKKIAASFILVLFLVSGTVLPTNIVHASTLQDITLGSTVTGSFTSTNIENEYRIVLPKAGKVDIKLTSQIPNSLEVYLVDTISGKDAITSGISAGSAQSPLVWERSIDLEAGTYYFKIDNDLLGPGTYTLNVNFTAANTNDVEPNNDRTTAQTLTLNASSISGYISWNDDVDVYKLVVSKSGRIGITVSSQIYDSAAALADAYGNLLDLNVFTGSARSPQTWVSSNYLAAGTYYLAVGGDEVDTGKYSVKASTYSQVSFNSNGGSLVPSQSVIYNGKAFKPSNPTKTGYTFSGWYKDSSLTSLFDFINTPITGNITLYAKWVIAAPASVKATSSGYNSIKASWSSVSGVSGYEIYRSTSSSGTYSKVGETTATSYTNTYLGTGTTYYYKVRAYKLVGTTRVYGYFSSVVSAKPVPAAPASVQAASSGYNSIKTSWSSVSGASGYAIYRSTSSSGTYSKVGETTATSYTNTYLATGTTYYYKVIPYRTVGTTRVYGYSSAIVSSKPVPSVPANFNAVRVNSTSINLSWGGVSGASGYEIYRATSSTGAYGLLKTTTSLSFINTGLITGRTYYYKVRAYRMVGSTKVYSNWTVVKYARP